MNTDKKQTKVGEHIIDIITCNLNIKPTYVEPMN